jgi:hypothetical protein
MSTFRTPDGQVYRIPEGREGELIDLLRKEMWTDFSKREYVERIANLVASMFGVWINTDTPKAFVDALVDLQLIDKVEE